MTARSFCVMGFALLHCAIAAGCDTDIAGLQLRADQGDPDGQFHAGFYLCCKMPSTIAHDEVTAVTRSTSSGKAGLPRSGMFLEGIGAGLSDAKKAEVIRRVNDRLRTPGQQAYRGVGRSRRPLDRATSRLGLTRAVTAGAPVDIRVGPAVE